MKHTQSRFNYKTEKKAITNKTGDLNNTRLEGVKQSRSLKVSLCKGCMKKVIFPIVLAQSPLGIVLWNHMTIKQRRFLSLYKHGTKNKVSFPIRIEPLTFRLT